MNAKALLLRVGLDRGTGGALGPIFSDGTFEYIPIPETVPTDCPFTYATLAGRYVSALAKVLPARLAELRPHIDPDFKSCTYGDAAPRKRRQLQRLASGDLLVFYAGLAPDPPVDRSRLFAVGYFRVKRVHHLKGSDTDRADLVRSFSGTAHFLRRERDAELALVEGEPSECISFDRALALGDEQDRLFLDLACFGYQGSLLRAVGHWIDSASGMKALEAWLHSGPASLVTSRTRLIPIAPALRPLSESHLAIAAKPLREGDWVAAVAEGEARVQALGRINRIARDEQPGRGISSLYWCFAEGGPAPFEGYRLLTALARHSPVQDTALIRNLVTWFARHYRTGFHLRA